MSANETKYDDEIDLLSVIQTIWDGKWKIVLFMLAAIFCMFGYNIVKVKNFIATTEIRPIATFEEDKYRLFNQSFNQFTNKFNQSPSKIDKDKNKNKENIKYKDIVFEYIINYKGKDIAEFLGDDEKYIANIFQITNKSLLKQYVEEIKEGSLLEVGIQKFNLIDKEKFDDEKDYIEAVKKFASEIRIINPQKANSNGKRQKLIPYHLIKGEYSDIEKWKELLVFIDVEINKKVKEILINRFETIMSVQKQKRDFEIEDLNTQIINVKQDYEEKMKNRLAFLAEQASIARKLDIKKNIIQPQTVINTADVAKTNLKIEGNPFYLRGYIAIEEEMRLINTRKNKTSFMESIYELEKLKRVFEQDKTLERAIELFYKTPLNQNDFQATIVKVAATDYKTNNKTNLYYALAIVLGSMIGVFYVLIANAFRNRKNETVSFLEKT